MKTSYGEFRIATLREVSPDYTCDQPTKVQTYWDEVILPSIDPCKEHLFVLLLNNRCRILGHTMVSMGTVNECAAHPREVFRAAILAGCTTIVMIHNHPSGDPSPSEVDIKMTRRMIEVGKVVGIEVTDHVVMGDQRHCSLRQLGFIHRPD